MSNAARSHSISCDWQTVITATMTTMYVQIMFEPQCEIV